MQRPLLITIALIILSLVASCAAPDYWPTEERPISTPEEQGMDSAKLGQVLDYIDEQNLDVHSLLVVRNGYIVLEEYWGTYDKDTTHVVHSVTKSFISALIAIAMKEGYIESLEQKMVDFFPERTIKNLDSRKEAITLEHMLTMTAGFEWGETEYLDTRNPIYGMRVADDTVQYILDKEMVAVPGEVWEYNSGSSHLLSVIIHETTGYDTLDFANEFLFEPLGITDVAWEQDAQGFRYGGWGLSLTPRDMAKFGLLYLNNGAWEGEQIIPAEYVVDSTETHYSLTTISGYGYLWWTQPTLEAFGAAGLGGQFIGVLPELDIVVVFTASLAGDWFTEHYYPMLWQYVIEACYQEA